MNRLAIFLTLLAVSVAACFKTMDLTNETPLNLAAFVAHDRETRKRSTNYYSFKRGFDAALDALGAGDVDLRTAHAHVFALALCYNPDFFNHLGHSEQGDTAEERLARNLVGHIRNIEESCPKAKPRLPQLDAELQAYLLQLETGRRR